MDVGAEIVLHLVIEAVVEHGSLSLLSTLDEGGLGLELVLLVLGDDIMHFLPLLTVVLVLEHKHVSLLNFEVKSILELLGLLGGLLFESSELTLALFNDGIDVHEAVIAEHLLFLLEDLCGTVDKNLFIFLLSKGFL